MKKALWAAVVRMQPTLLHENDRGPMRPTSNRVASVYFTAITHTKFRNECHAGDKTYVTVVKPFREGAGFKKAALFHELKIPMAMSWQPCNQFLLQFSFWKNTQVLRPCGA